MPSLEVVFRHRGLRSFDCSAMVGTVQRLLDARGVNVKIRFGGDQVLSASQMQSVDVFGCDVFTGAHRQLFQLVKLTSPPQVVVFIVNHIVDEGPYAGCAQHPAECPGLVLTEAAAAGGTGSTNAGGRWVLAHELCHVLGLTHSGSAASLMFRDVTAISSSMPDISNAEKARLEGSRWLGAVSSPATRSIPVASVPSLALPGLAPRPRTFAEELGW